MSENIVDSLNIAQVRSLERVQKDGIDQVLQKHMAVALRVIEIVCDAAKDQEGNIHPVILNVKKTKNILDDEAFI